MLYPMELKLMELIWVHAPVTLPHLCRLAADAIGWKRTTTYTVVSRLCDRGYLLRTDSTVMPILTRQRAEEEAVVTLLEEYFGGKREELIAVLDRIFDDDREILDKSFDK